MASLSIYCADIGSVPRGKFGWARHSDDDLTRVPAGDDEKIEQLVASVRAELNAGAKVALGFECPLFVPVPDTPIKLGTARAGEGSRPWSAGAGAGALATGLVQVAWILRELAGGSPGTPTFLDWASFDEADQGLLLWEAFVSGQAKHAGTGNPHCADAAIAVERFSERLPRPDAHADVVADRPLSVVGAAMLWSGLSDDVALLHRPCLVVKAAAPAG